MTGCKAWLLKPIRNKNNSHRQNAGAARPKPYALPTTPGYTSCAKRIRRQEQAIDPKAVDRLQPGSWLATSGLIYSDSPELLAKVSLFGAKENALVLEQPDWWSSQARSRRILDPYPVRQGEIGDASGYRTVITKTGEKRPDWLNLQKPTPFSRLVYGLSSAYLMNGNPRVLRARCRVVHPQRERLRVDRTVSWLHTARWPPSGRLALLR